MKKIKPSVFILVPLLSGVMVSAMADPQFDQNMKNADQVYKQQQADKQREELRDKSHDLPRVKIKDNMSVGADLSKPEANVKITY